MRGLHGADDLDGFGVGEILVHAALRAGPEGISVGVVDLVHGDAAGAATMFRQYAAKLGDDADMHREFFRDLSPTVS